MAGSPTAAMAGRNEHEPGFPGWRRNRNRLLVSASGERLKIPDRLRPVSGFSKTEGIELVRFPNTPRGDRWRFLDSRPYRPYWASPPFGATGSAGAVVCHRGDLCVDQAFPA